MPIYDVMCDECLMPDEVFIPLEDLDEFDESDEAPKCRYCGKGRLVRRVSAPRLIYV